MTYKEAIEDEIEIEIDQVSEQLTENAILYGKPKLIGNAQQKNRFYAQGEDTPAGHPWQLLMSN